MKKFWLFLVILLISSGAGIFSKFIDFVKCEASMSIGPDINFLKSSNHSGSSGNFSFVTELNPLRFKFYINGKSVYASMPISARYNSISKLTARTYLTASWDFVLGIRGEYHLDDKIGVLAGIGYGVEYYPLQFSSSALFLFEMGAKYRINKFISASVKENFEKSVNKFTLGTDLTVIFHFM